MTSINVYGDSVGLLSSIREEQAGNRHGPRCYVCTILAGMKPEDSKDLQAAIDDHSIYGTVISRVLKKYDFDVTPFQVQRHRRKECMSNDV